MIYHQIKTIEQAAELYQELVAEAGNLPASRVDVLDYEIQFRAERPDQLWIVRIDACWGERTDSGFTEISATVKNLNEDSIRFEGFHCNREEILGAIVEPHQIKVEPAE